MPAFSGVPGGARFLAGESSEARPKAALLSFCAGGCSRGKAADVVKNGVWKKMIDIKNYGRKIQYYETDRMGIVHHSNYIRWMEEARIDTLAQIGIPYDKIEKAGILIPVLEASCEYRISFRFGEEFSIRVLPDRFSGIKMSMKYEIYGAHDGLLHATGHTGHCFLDKSMKPVHLKRDYPEIYGRLSEYMSAE